ncbi:hypothetical protein [Mesorhizobium sp.]|uniref:hypothetical protein n=1 Tax=Mesorhizobium sp. TaxID=1871066 RepID=UPI00257A6487|nr:hypothetical protein [Mesorhizobium sp.]
MRRRSIQDRTGPFWYRRPADPWQGEWEQIRLGEGVDAIAAIDVDGGRAEVIAQRGAGETLNLAWLQAQQASARALRNVQSAEAGSHELGAQGHALAQIVEGGRPSLRSQAVSECSTFPSPRHGGGGR